MFLPTLVARERRPLDARDLPAPTVNPEARVSKTVTTQAALPCHCMALHPYEKGGDGKPLLILVQRGVEGYWPCHCQTVADADAFNERRGVTPAMREAMLYGSVFGWSLPIADPAKHADAQPLAKVA